MCKGLNWVLCLFLSGWLTGAAIAADIKFANDPFPPPM
jgi:hypothetical protein